MPNQELFTRALSWLCTYAVHSSVLLGAVWLFLRGRAPRSLALRERLWKLALVGPLVTATLQLGLDARPWLGRLEWSARAANEEAPPPAASQPTLTAAPDAAPAGAAESAAVLASRTAPAERPARTSAPLPRASTATQERTAPSSTAPGEWPRGEQKHGELEEQEQEVEPPPPLGSLRSTPRRGAPSAAEERGPAAAGSSTDATPGTRVLPLVTPPSWPGLVLLAWAALGSVGVALVAGSFVLLWRRLQGREVLRAGPLVTTLEELRQRAGLRRHVRLSISSRVASPFSTGLLFPEICLPRAVVSALTPAQQEVLLAHELGHLLRRDPFWFAASAMLERLFFFQPLNRVARHELSELAELACDDHAVRWTGSRLALASCLTEVAGWLLEEPRRRLALPGLTAPRSPLGRRIARLLDDRRSPSAEGHARSFPLFAFGALGLTVAAVPGIHAASPAPTTEALVPEKVDAGPPEPRRPLAGSTLPLEPTPAAAAPSQPAPESPAPAESLALDELRRGLTEELARLAAEVEALRIELEQRDLDTRFAPELAAIEARLAALDAQHARASALLDTLVPALPSTPALSTR